MSIVSCQAKKRHPHGAVSCFKHMRTVKIPIAIGSGLCLARESSWTAWMRAPLSQEHRQSREPPPWRFLRRSEEHTSELQSLMPSSYAVFCLKTKKHTTKYT